MDGGTFEVGLYDAKGALVGTKMIDLSELECIDLSDSEDQPAPACAIDVGPRKWFVLQTTLHGEKDAQEALKERGFDTYLPIMRKETYRRQSRKTVVIELLLLNRYLFAELPDDPEKWRDVRKIEEVKGVLGCNGKPQPIKEEVIRRFVTAQANLEFDDTREAKIKRKEIGRNRKQTTAMRYPVGSRLRALSGPFGGFAGHVVSVTGRGTVKAMLSIFGGMTLVEFAAEAVEPNQ